MSLPTAVREQFATAEDGTPLFWDVYLPDAGVHAAPWVVEITIHGGGFRDEEHSPEQQSCIADSQAAGRAVVRPDYRLANPNVIPGQAASITYPASLNDLKRCALAAKTPAVSSILHGNVTGTYVVIGGSAGASFAAWLACDTSTQSSPVAWDTSKRALGSVVLSGALAFDDTKADMNLQAFEKIVHNYCGTTNLTTLKADSPYTTVTAAASPMWLRNGTSENMPQNQLALMVAALDAAGVTNYVSTLDSTVVPSAHAWAAYPSFGPTIQAFLASIAAGGTPPPPPPPNAVPQGICALYGDGVMPDQSVLDDPDIDMVTLRLSWATIEPTAGTYDYATFIDPQIKRIAAAGKKCLIRILTSGGSATFGGSTPDHVFDAIGTALSGPPTSFSDGVSNGTPLITSATAKFTYADLFQSITGTDIPANSYVGQVISHTNINLSSSNTVYTPVNATGSHTGNTVALPGRFTVGHAVHGTVFGSTYTWDNTGANGVTSTTTIPVFWEPTYMLKKANMLTALGKHINFSSTFTQTERQSVQVVAVGVANSTSEDWNIPVSPNIQPNYTISQLDAWLNGINETTKFPGAGYDPQLIIDAEIKQLSGQGYADGASTSSSNVYTSATALFRLADVGKVITGTNIPNGTKIQSVTSNTAIKLSAAATGTGTGLTFSIKQRDVGLLDLVMASWANQYVAVAIGNDGLLLDAAGATRDGDTDPKNYLARTICAQAAAKYPGRFVAQVNSVSAKMPTSDNPGDNQYSLLEEINASGRPTAGQNLSVVFGDSTYRMNGGIAGDPDQICQQAANNGFTYGMQYDEVYSKDCINLPASVTYIHLLLTRQQGPPPPPSATPPPSQIKFRTVKFQDSVINGVANLLRVNPADLSSELAQRWISSINTHTDYAWSFYAWPDFYIVEERAFREVWNADDVYANGDEFYYLGTLQTDGTYVGTGYYTQIGLPPQGTLPTNNAYFTPFTLTGTDYYIELLQRCRRRIGEVNEVYDSDPRNLAPTTLARALPWQLSQRGIEVACGQNTVFVRFKAEPWLYTSIPWSADTIYVAGDLVINTDGEVYRSIKGSPAGQPAMNSPQWAWVGYSRFLRDYAVYMTASDNSEDAQNAARFEMQAEKFLVRQTDKLIGQGVVTVPGYQLTTTSRHKFPPRFPVVATVPATEPVNTISDVCLDEWGDIIPVTTS